MNEGARPDRIDAIASEAIETLGTGRQVAPFSERYPGFDMAEAYRVVARMRDLRQARGETPAGRKIGFTNTAVWDGYGISGPIWHDMYDTTVSNLAPEATFALAGLPEPRIEPEIMLHLARAPAPDMTEEELLACIDWVAPGFEIVQSIFPGWRFSAADAVAGYGLHAALLVGERLPISGDIGEWREMLSSFTVELVRADGLTRSGHASRVLGGPVKALGFLVRELVRYPGSEPLKAGELITTGTLTEAMPAIAGESWSARFTGIPAKPPQISFA